MTLADLARPDPLPETLMFSEAGEAGRAARAFLDRNRDTLERIGQSLRAQPPKFVITCARGSSDHAATYAKYMIETHLGVPTASAALSVASLYGVDLRGADGLCIAISQSGRSPDLLTTVAALKASGAFVVAIVNDETSPLAELADACLPLSAGPELSVAATKSYITTLCAIAALTAAWAHNDELDEGLKSLPGALDRGFARDWSAALPALTEARNLFVIGRGYSFAAAQEAALKLKETCGIHAEAFSSAEVRHGPMAIVNDGFPILAFAASDETGADVRAVCAEFAARGADVYLAVAGEEIAPFPAQQGCPALEALPMVASFYRLANAAALARGLNPDAPPHLKKVTRTT